MFDDIPPGVEADSREYWKARARQWQKRAMQAEREKSQIIADLTAAKAENARLRADKRTHLSAIRSGDLQVTARDYQPRSL